MLDYIFAGGIFFGSLHLIKKYNENKQLWKKYDDTIKKNEQLFNELIPKTEKLAKIINESSNKEDMLLFEDIKKYLDAPKICKEGRDKIREYFSNSNSSYTQEIIYHLLDDIEEDEKELKNLGDKIARDILKKF